MSSIYHFNQEQPLTGLTNTQVSDLVSSNLPENTYTSIAVNSINYRFPLTEEPIQARHISLKISHVAVGWSSLKVFLGRMLNVHVEEGNLLNTTLIACQILGNHAGNSYLEARGLKEIKKAYKECYNITLIISDDCNFCELTLKQQRFYIIARQAGQIAQTTLALSLAIAPFVPIILL